MTTLIRVTILVFLSVIAVSSVQAQKATLKGKLAIVSLPDGRHYILEAFPERVAKSRDLYSNGLRSAASSVGSLVPFYVIVEASRRWPFDRTVRVAFRGGNDALYSNIENAADEWISIGGANVKLSFRDPSGNFYQWSPTDIAYSGEIRISFSLGGTSGGYWSHVGTDSNNSRIEGGAPNQASMNLDSFDVSLPVDWRSITIHEFGHALGFEHEHQNPKGGCDFKFKNDPGYKLTKDAQGYVTNDSSGRRPGLYAYLAGKANYWDEPKVNRNLKAIDTNSAFAVGPFDKFSVMKYFFKEDMFISAKKSPCFTERDQTQTISAQDVVGVRAAYPSTDAEMDAVKRSTVRALAVLRDSPRATAHVQNTAAERMKSFR